MSNKNYKKSDPTFLEQVLRLQGDLRKSLKPIGVTPLQAGVLCYLHRHVDSQLGETAAALHVQQPTLVDVVKDLVRKRWVTSRRSLEDRRAVCLQLTPNGAALVRMIQQRVLRIQDLLIEHERDALRASLQSRRS